MTSTQTQYLSKSTPLQVEEQFHTFFTQSEVSV